MKNTIVDTVSVGIGSGAKNAFKRVSSLMSDVGGNTDRNIICIENKVIPRVVSHATTGGVMGGVKAFKRLPTVKLLHKGSKR